MSELFRKTLQMNQNKVLCEYTLWYIIALTKGWIWYPTRNKGDRTMDGNSKKTKPNLWALYRKKANLEAKLMVCKSESQLDYIDALLSIIEKQIRKA